MDHLSGSAPASLPPTPRRPFNESLLYDVFFNEKEMRAGWRLLLFFALIAALSAAGTVILRFTHHRRAPVGFTLSTVLVTEAASFCVFLIASFVMAVIEKRTLADYGLPWKLALHGEFWRGSAIGFVSITILLVAMWAAGVFHFGTILHGGVIMKYAALWAFAFLLVALFEELSFRGYALFTLSSGIGFWPAATILSAIFGYVHHANPGETWLGAFSAGAIGFVLCLMLRRSGNLWMPIGFHAAWDWGETFFYGVPDSGQVAPGHFLDSSLSGPKWLTGGSVGPEASWLCILLIFLLGCAIAAFVNPPLDVNASLKAEPLGPSDASE